MGCQDTHVEFLSARTCLRIRDMQVDDEDTIKCMVPTHSVKLDVTCTYLEKFF